MSSSSADVVTLNASMMKPSMSHLSLASRGSTGSVQDAAAAELAAGTASAPSRGTSGGGGGGGGSTPLRSFHLGTPAQVSPLLMSAAASSSVDGLESKGVPPLGSSGGIRPNRSAVFGTPLLKPVARVDSDDQLYNTVVQWEVDPTDIDFEDVSRVGAGAHAEVFKARWRGTPCAIKRLNTEGSAGGGGRASALTEIRHEIALMAHMHHPRVVQFLGAYTKGDPWLILFEYLKGGSVAQVIAKRKGKPLPPKLAGRWALDAAQGLRYLHEHKPLPVVHRDFKPQNLLIDGSGHCKIADFGLAKVVKIIASRTSALAMGGVASAAGAPGTPVSSSAGSSTPVSAGREGSGGGGSGSGSGVNPARTMPLSPDSPTAASAAEGDNTGESGSYRYMAPEVFRHERYTEKVDIFSFGMIMFQLFSPDSHAPFHSLPSLQAAEAMALRNERPELSPKLPRELAALIEQCWAPDPTKRPTALQCCTVLEALFPDDGKSVPLSQLLEEGGGCTVV